MKKYSKILCTTLTVLTVMVSSLPAFAASNDGASSDKAIKAAQKGVYDQTIIDKEWSKVKSKPIEADKVPTNNSVVKSSTTTSSTGTYPTRNGVILVTADAYKGLIPTGHAAIIWTYGTVVESLSGGVTTGPSNWYSTKKTCYGVTVRGTTNDQDNEASNWCYNQFGKKYNFDYFNPYTRSKFYCSQLVYAAFLDLYGIDMNTSASGVAVHPMALVNTPETSLLYSK